MAHEIEADYKEEWENEETQCSKCTSFDSSTGFCSEAGAEVSPNAHCDFFQSID